MAATEYFQIIRDRSRTRAFHSLFLFVTSRCNSVCRTCFYFDKLNSPDDLTFDQIDRISASAPPFRKLWLSGGEPTLREGLGEIVEMFVRRNGVRNLNLPTNGLLPERVFRPIDHLLSRCPDLAIDLNFSLDGLANTNDAIRGVPNNFRRTIETLEETGRRYRGVRRLRRNVVTVITSENYRELRDFGIRMLDRGDADGHYFEIIRGAAPDGSLKAVALPELRSLHRQLLPLYGRYAEKLFGHLPRVVRRFATLYYLGNIRFHFEWHEKCLDGPRPWPMPCTAGQTALVIDHNGAFRACELRGVLGNLRDYDFNVGEVLESPAMKAEVADIPKANCWCTHSCFLQDSSKFSTRVQLFHIPWLGLQELMGRGTLRDLAPHHALELPG